MRKITRSFFLITVSLCAFSCTRALEKEIDGSLSDLALLPTDGQEVILTATVADADPETKSARFNKTFYWGVGDKISLFYGPGDQGGSEFTSTHTSSDGDDGYSGYVKRTTFRGTITAITGLSEGEDNLKFWGIFPYSTNNSCVDGGAAVITDIPTGQQTDCNSWGSSQNICIGRSDGLVMGFYNLCGGIQFKLSQRQISRIVFRGNNNETVAGTVKVVMDADGHPQITEWLTEEKEIVLTTSNSFVVSNTTTGEVYYYLILPPVTFSRGFAITLYDDDNEQCATFVETRSREIKRNVFGKYSAPIDEGLEYVETPAGANQIIYYVEGQDPISGSNLPQEVSAFLASAQSHEFDSTTGCGVLTFASDVTDLPSAAFCRTPVTKVVLPSSLKTIHNSAFSECSALREVVLPQGLEYICYGAFSDCSSLESIYLPSSLLGIGVTDNNNHQPFYNSFSRCTSLAAFYGSGENFQITDDHKFLLSADGKLLISGAMGGFENQPCMIPWSVETIGMFAMSGGSSSSLSLTVNNLTEIGNYSFENYSVRGSFYIPQTVQSIGPGAFQGLSFAGSFNTINGIFFSDDVLPSIGQDAFGDVENETFNVYVTGTATVVSSSLLNDAGLWFNYKNAGRIQPYQDSDEIWYHRPVEGTQSLDASLNFGTETNPVHRMTSQGDFVFYINEDYGIYNEWLPYILSPSDASFDYIGIWKMDGPVTAVPANAFAETDFDYISIPDVRSIGDDAFLNCGNLKVFPVRTESQMTSIGNRAFANCITMRWQADESNKYMKLPYLTSLGSNAFAGCENLDGVLYIGQVSGIPNYAFQGCGKLTHVLISNPAQPGTDPDAANSVTYIGAQAFDGCRALKAVTSWSTLGENYFINLPNVVTLGFTAFQNCTAIQKAVFGAIPTIPNDTFSGCSHLESVTLSSIDNLTEIEDRAFHGCTSLVKVCAADNTLVEPGAYVSNVTRVGSGAFSSTAIPRVSIAAQVTLGLSAFANCPNLHSVNLPNVDVIPYGCFMNCTSLSTTNIAAVSTIGEKAFYRCSALEALRLVNTNNLTTIEREAFSECTSLQAVGPTGITFVQIPYALTIGTSAFGNTAIRSVSAIRATDIGASAFAACPNLVQVSLNAATTLPHSCFYNDAALTTVNVPAVTTVSTEAFYRCTSLQTLILPAVVTIGDRAFAYTKNLADLEFGESLTTLGRMIFFDDSTDGSRNYGKLELTFAGPYPTSLYSAFNGSTPTFAYTDSQQDLFMPKKVYVNEDYYGDYLDNFPDDWDQSINALVQQYRP